MSADLETSQSDIYSASIPLRSVIEAMTDCVLIWSANGRLLDINAAARRMLKESLGLTAAQAFGEGLPDKWLRLDEHGQPLGEGQRPTRRVFRSGSAVDDSVVGLQKPDGSRVWFSVCARPILLADGVLRGVVMTAREITELKRNEMIQQSLNRSLRMLSKCNQLLIDARDEATLLREVCKLIVESGGYSAAGIYVADPIPAKSVSRIAGYAANGPQIQVEGLSWREDAPEASAPVMVALRTAVLQVCQDLTVEPRPETWRQFLSLAGCRSCASLPLQNANGLRCALSIAANEPGRFVSDELALLRELVDDLSFGLRILHTRREHQAAEQQLAFLARHDPLTHLPNRLLLRERFEQALACARERHERIAMLFIDLDSFKEINDSLGHEVGDKLLICVAERLQNCIGSHDIVSREGGDEFLLVLTQVTDSSAIADVARRILEAVEPPFRISENALHTTLSIGISIYPDDGEDFEELRRNSDAALFRAKDGGRNTFRFFDQQMNVDAVARVHLQAGLRRALQHGEFRLHYQLQVDTGHGRILGVEALIRWQQPDGELISPDQFIPAAEKSGLIVPIGEWVLHEACRQAMIWRASHMPELVIAVNLSVAQFARGNIVETVLGALHETGLPALALELELTESVLLHDTEAALQTMQQLKNIGVRLAIDDFGTGFSSLAYVKRLSVDKLKIAHSFVKEMVQNPQDAAIVRAIIQLARTLQLEVIAEGVETVEQLALLRSYGCDLIQGYLVGRPVPAEQLTDRNSITMSA